MTSAAENPDGSFTPCSWLARLPTRTLEKIAPKIAVPNEPPIDRKNVAPEVATPSSLCGTAFWTMMTSTCMTPPMPMPSTSMYSAVQRGRRGDAHPGQQEQADGHQRGARDREEPVLARSWR